MRRESDHAWVLGLVIVAVVLALAIALQLRGM